jgi:hypothetical protein
MAWTDLKACKRSNERYDGSLDIMEKKISFKQVADIMEQTSCDILLDWQ